MNRHSRFIVLILSLTLLASAFSVTANAEEVVSSADTPVAADSAAVESEIPVDPPESAIITPEPQPSYVEPSQQEQPSQQQQSEQQPQSQQEQPQESYVEPEIQQSQESYVEPIQQQESYVESYVEPEYNNPESNDDSVYYDADGNEYSDYSDVYVGGDQTYTPPASTAPSAPIYDTSKTKVDETTLSDSDWKDIKAKLGGSSSKNSDDGDFGFIQNNTSTDDNGHLILIIGIALLALSACGFGYLVFSAVNRRKKTALAHAGKSGQTAQTAKSSGKSSGSHSSGKRYRSNSDYNDNFSSDNSAKASQKNSSGKSKNAKRYK